MKKSESEKFTYQYTSLNKNTTKIIIKGDTEYKLFCIEIPNNALSHVFKKHSMKHFKNVLRRTK